MHEKFNLLNFTSFYLRMHSLKFKRTAQKVGDDDVENCKFWMRKKHQQNNSKKIKFHYTNKPESNTEKRFYKLLEAMPDKNEFLLISINSTEPQSLQQLLRLTKKGIQTLCVDFQRKRVLAMQQSFNSGKKCNFGHQNWFLFSRKKIFA